MLNLYKSSLYAFLKDSASINKRDIRDMYMDLLTIIAAGEHEYRTPDFNKYFYEIAIGSGVAAFYKCRSEESVNYDKWCCTPAFPADQINNMLTAKKITTSGSDYSVELEVEKDCILLFNNSAHASNYIFCKYADDLTETAVSASKLTKWSRMTPIPRVNNDADIAKYETLMKRILDGEDINVITEELSLLQEGHRTLDDNVLRLTDESAVEKLHFFDQHAEQILRRFATIRGLPFSTTAKSAQNLQDELHDMDAVSTFMIQDEIDSRREGFERAAKFMKDFDGTEFDFAYKPSDVLLRQLDRTRIEYTSQLAEADRIQSEASQKVSDGIMREAQAKKFIAEAQKLEAEAEDIEEGSDSNDEERNEAEAAVGDTAVSDE